MPTYEWSLEYRREFAKLTEVQQKSFRRAVKKFVIDLKRDGQLRGSLRDKPMVANPGIFELTWESEDGRATFTYGPKERQGEKHVIWHRIGGHEIFDRP